jgi:hypothetical protein
MGAMEASENHPSISSDSAAASPSGRSLEPLRYQQAVADCLQQQSPDLWEWFSSNRVQRENVEAVRLDLLKRTYRLEADRHGELYDLARQAAAAPSLANKR